MRAAPSSQQAIAFTWVLSATPPSQSQERGRGGGARCGRIRRRGSGLRHRGTEIGMGLLRSAEGGRQIRRWTLCLEAHDRIGCRTVH
jgi:hypothetical protein